MRPLFDVCVAPASSALCTGWGEIVRTRRFSPGCGGPRLRQCSQPLLALLGSTKTRGLRVDAAHVDVALRSPSKTTPSASCSGRGAPSRRGRRAGVNARTTGNLLTQGSQAPGQTALRRNTRMQFRKLGCLAHLRSMRVAFRSCSYPRSTKVLITAFGPFGLTWPREPCNG